MARDKMTSSWGLLTFSGEGKDPKRTFCYSSSAKMVSYGHVLLPGCWEFQSQFPSLSSGGSIGEDGWEWLLGELISRNTEKTQLTSHLLVLPNYQLNGHDLPLLRISFMVPSAFCMLVFLILQVPVNAFPWGRNSLMNESRYLFLSSFSYSVYFLHDA